VLLVWSYFVYCLFDRFIFLIGLGLGLGLGLVYLYMVIGEINANAHYTPINDLRYE